MMDDPYHDFKVRHKAGLMDSRGQVSALCFPTPRSINLKRETWTLRDVAVTCPKCLEALGVPDARAEAKRRREVEMKAVSQ
jgi:hypothetical protein